ncbi:hypothetical protein [Stenotrophomonas maltophilia]|uniref:hypothetical protein n=1 Tax=Stenotrophomonas maltophilia TaxID=40324 RepID=UPI0021C60DDE|nr:hypothetical protein [Stenotrophomonas maltophilia]MCU1169668.1 hypothetical protein [Stenotrophomonas maltophilia]
MTSKFNATDFESILATPKPSGVALPADQQLEFQARLSALASVLGGATLIDAALRWGVPRNTLSRMIQNALLFDENGHRVGFRACIPYARFSVSSPRNSVVPDSSHPFAIDAVLQAIPELGAAVARFKGALPTKSKKSPVFDRLHSQFVKVLSEMGLQARYPLNIHDKGRRALVSFIVRSRGAKSETEMALATDEPSATRIENLLSIRPFDRVEYDEHSVDIDAWLAMPMADGSYQLEKISRIWLLAAIDVGSGAILGWELVIGRKYEQHDVVSLFAKIMSPWKPRDLSASDLSYSTNAWMPSTYLVDEVVMRSAMIAMDNDSSHHAKMTVRNLIDHHKGILHFGRSGMGEGRPYIEALFKKIENGLLRYIAGGFSPATQVNEKQVTTSLDGKDHPILLEVLKDLIDTYVTSRNVTSRSTREPRSPKRIIDEHLASGEWVWHAPGTEDDVRKVTVRRMKVTIRGSKKNGVPPLVYLDHARYRSPVLSGQWHLIGQSFDATYEDWRDIRKLTLWRGGKRVLTLHALAPYAGAAHTLSIRKRAARWAKSDESREHSDHSMGDNILAYHAAVRSAAAGIRDTSSLLAGGDVPKASPQAKHRVHDSPLGGIRRTTFNTRLR